MDTPDQPSHDRAVLRDPDAADPSSEDKGDGWQPMQASALKALAHPLRVEIIDALASYGPATASALAERLNESSGATSYHLRQLAKHGLIVEDPDRGTQRERWWTIRPGGMAVDPSQYEGDAAAEAASMQVARQILEQRYRHADAFLRHLERGGKAPDAGVAVVSMHLRCTDEEREEIVTAVNEVLNSAAEKYRDRRNDDSYPLAEVQFAAFPMLDPQSPQEQS